MSAAINVVSSHQSSIVLHGVSKVFPSAAGGFAAVDMLELELRGGEFVAIVGQSGSGKSTLLNLLAGIERPTSGSIAIDGVRIDTLRERELSAWRGRAVGIVFQFFQLLPTLTALENVMLPMDFARRWPPRERRARAESLLDRLGVADQAHKLPAALSGGQQQRVAIGRALANAPTLLLADEPTGNLDSRNAAQLLDLFASLVGDGLTLVMVTHQNEAAARAGRVVRLADGRIIGDGPFDRV
jgi:putative ABC transport system ATP-binding protein